MRKPSIENVEAEIRKEKAESLGRTGERLEQALAEIRMLRDQILALAEDQLRKTGEGLSIPAEAQAAVARHTELCALARDMRYQLIVQREAVGFRRHEDVDRHYPLPAPLTLAMLIRREGSR